MSDPIATPAELRAELVQMSRRLDEIAIALKHRGDKSSAILAWDARDLLRSITGSMDLGA